MISFQENAVLTVGGLSVTGNLWFVKSNDSTLQPVPSTTRKFPVGEHLQMQVQSTVLDCSVLPKEAFRVKTVSLFHCYGLSAVLIEMPAFRLWGNLGFTRLP